MLGYTMTKPFRPSEKNDLGAAVLISLFRTPRFIKKIYAFVLRYILRDPVTAGLLENFHKKDIAQVRDPSPELY